jgi:outer membrane protein assembly factor BamB
VTHGPFVFVGDARLARQYPEDDRIVALVKTSATYPLAANAGSSIWFVRSTGDGTEAVLTDGLRPNEPRTVMLGDDVLPFSVRDVIAVDDGAWLLSAEQQRPRMAHIDEATLAVTAIKEPQGLDGGLTSGFGGVTGGPSMWVGTTTGEVAELDARTGDVIRSVAAEPKGAAIVDLDMFDGRRRVVALSANGAVLAIDRESEEVVSLDVPGNTVAIAASLNGSLLAGSSRSGEIWLLRAGTDTPAERIAPDLDITVVDMAVREQPRPAVVVVTAPDTIIKIEAAS